MRLASWEKVGARHGEGSEHGIPGLPLRTGGPCAQVSHLRSRPIPSVSPLPPPLRSLSEPRMPSRMLLLVGALSSHSVHTGWWARRWTHGMSVPQRCSSCLCLGLANPPSPTPAPCTCPRGARLTARALRAGFRYLSPTQGLWWASRRRLLPGRVRVARLIGNGALPPGWPAGTRSPGTSSSAGPA